MNSVVHFEIPSDDIERAKEFYQEVFGWKANDMSQGEKYYMMQTGETSEKLGPPKVAGYINGGLAPRKGNLTCPSVTIEVKDIDSALEKIEAAGGSAVGEKMAVGDMGWSSFFKDSEGNIIGLWQNKEGV